MKRLLSLFILCIFLSGCRVQVYKAEQTRTIMGTEIKIVAIHEDSQVAGTAVRRAFSPIHDVDELMSTYDNSSEVSRLNKQKSFQRPHHDLVLVLEKSAYYSDLSDGAFDITVQPILGLYKQSFTVENRSPTEAEINRTLRSVNYKKVIIFNNTVTIGENMSITLGGIAKGFAIDRAIEVLQSYGISRALVNAGGDVAAIGTKHLKQPWVVALQNPRNESDYITLIELHNQSVATSGDYARYFDEDRAYHHIINPKTGRSATELISVTVIAPKAVDADALATTVFVLGREKGLKLIEQTEDTEALLITKDREIIRSSGFLY